MSTGAGEHSPQHLLGLLLEQAKHYALILLDPHGNVLFWGAASESVFGYSADEVVGRSYAQLFTPEDLALRVPEHELRVASENGSSQDDRWMLRRDGSRFWANGVVLPIRASDGELLALAKILRDRTDVKTQTEHLQNRVQALSEENQRRNTFLTAFAHEIRNNLVPLKLVVELIRSTAEVSESLATYLTQAEDQLDTTQRLVTDLLDAARIGTGKLQIKNADVDLRDLLNRVVDAYRLVATERQQSLRLLYPAPTVVVDGDPGRLHQVFVNLVDNAVKYTPEGGDIWVKVYVEGKWVVVNVEDTGVGMPPELAARIFELFSQASSKGASESGLGIGLWLVKSLVELHGGTVAVRSEGEGRGSRFTVQLPLKRIHPE